MAEDPVKNRPLDLGKVRMCKKHKVYVKECPKCNAEVRGERHTDHARKRHK